MIAAHNEVYKNEVLDAPYEVCIERARFYTESYRLTEGEHPAIRAAKAFLHTCENMSLYILDNEKIIGNRSSKLVGAVIPVERGDINTVLELEIDMLSTREKNPYKISDADKKELLENILPYWKGKTLRAKKNELWKKNHIVFTPAFNPVSLYKRNKSLDLKRIKNTMTTPKVDLDYILKGGKELLYNNPAMVMNSFDVQGHLILGIKNILKKGFGGVQKDAEKRLKKAKKESDTEGIAFLESVIISCKAIRHLAKRFAKKAKDLAEQTKDTNRKNELLEIAEMCKNVPYSRPKTFREAIQAMWFTEIGAFIAYGMTGIFAVGRFDQYLYPFFMQDIKKRRITNSEATALVEELLIKLSYNMLLLPYVGQQTSNVLGADSCSPTIGGVNKKGKNAVNDLTYLMLDAFENVKATGNSFTIRLSEKTPEKFWKRSFEVFRKTSGAALFADEIAIESLKNCGVSEEDARDYGVIGCVEHTSDGNTFGCTSANDISFTAGLEMALLNGYLRIMGKTIGPKTGDPKKMKNFDELMEAFKSQIIFMVDVIAKAVNLKDLAYMQVLPCPYVSATLTGCVDNARDMTAGGAKYNFGSISARGLGTTVDSLAAIKHFVFDKKEISMERLLDALDNNFKNDDVLRAKLANRGPKYGCDDDYADSIAKEVVEFYCKEVGNRQNIRGGPFRPSFFSYGMHVLEGLFIGATPNGRVSGEPISNSFSPANGSEKAGPTAMLKSIAKIDHSMISNGCAVNIKFLPALFTDEERLGKMVNMIKTYFKMGGMELQPNVVSNETLKKAQENPEQYRDLVVRVSGYSAYFTDLGTPLQNEIISRTEFGKLG